jgi:type I restriction enzyme, S subunit
MSFPQYEKYKDSGVLWIGEVPEHWEVVGLTKYLASLVDYRGRTPTKSEDGIFLVTARNIRNGFIDYEASQEYIVPAEYEAVMSRGLPQVGDVLFTTEAPLGQVATIDRTDVALAQRIIKFRGDSSRLSNYFLKYWIMGSSCQFNLEQLATGSTALGIKGSKVGQVRLCLPPLDEQSEIALFLDREVRKVDALVEQQQRLIELLKEKRQAVISHAVIKGLNPDAAMKESGVEWLGEVPEQWQIGKFSREIAIAEGQVDPTVEPYKSMVLIGPEHVESKTGRLNKTETASEQSAESGKYLCAAGDVIYSKIRPALAKVVVAPAACLCSADMYPMRGNNQIENGYLYWLLLSEQFIAWSLLESDRVAMPKLNRETLAELRFPIPPRHEQMAIARYLERTTTNADSLMQEANRATELLRERRIALISAAVTGKIDVRQAVAEVVA